MVERLSLPQLGCDLCCAPLNLFFSSNYSDMATLWDFLLPHSVQLVQRTCKRCYLRPRIPFHDGIHGKWKAKELSQKSCRASKQTVNSLIAGCFHFAALCKGETSVDFSEMARSGVAKSPNAPGIN